MKIRRLDAAPHQLHAVLVAEPDRHLPPILRPLAERSDPQARDAEPVLVGIEAAQRLTEAFAHRIEAVRAHRLLRADRPIGDRNLPHGWRRHRRRGAPPRAARPRTDGRCRRCWWAGPLPSWSAP